MKLKCATGVKKIVRECYWEEFSIEVRVRSLVKINPWALSATDPLKESVADRDKYQNMEYIPSVYDEHSYQSYLEIEKAIASCREHMSYLTIKQIAMAVLNGLKKWGADTEAVLVAQNILDLAQVETHKPQNHELPY